MEYQEIALSPLLKEHVSMAAQHMRDRADTVSGDRRRGADVMRRFLEDVAASRPRVLDSAAEAVFLVWWQAITSWYSKVPLRAVAQREVLAEGSHYRIDFSIEPSALAERPWRPLGVEIDGHAFHERTRDQVTYRNTRDRALQRAGWQLMHFSFEELTTEPGRVVDEVFTEASRQWWRLDQPDSDIPTLAAHIEEPPF